MFDGSLDEARIREFVAAALESWQAPGAALALVAGGEQVFVGGVGVRELGKPALVDADTVFNVASVTKSFAASAAAVAVDQGLIEWDQPVIEHLPEFRLRDRYVSAAATYRDVFAHRVGIAGSYQNGLARSRREMVALLRHAPVTSPFRTQRVYSNLMYAAGGFSVANAAGTSWDEHMKSAIFDPLGMTRTTTSAHALAGDDNAASSHLRGRDGMVRADPFRPDGWWSMDNHAPAGAINSSANDMVRWLEFQLGDGTVDGHQILTRESLDETHRDQIAYEDSAWNADPLDQFPGFRSRAYALGWKVHEYAGQRVLEHGGLFRGHGSQVVIVPDTGLGIFVSVNSRDGARGLGSGIAHWILDRLLGLSETDWPALQLTRYRERLVMTATQEAQLLARPDQIDPSGPLEGYIGTYQGADEWETIVVTTRDGELTMEMTSKSEPYFAHLEHLHGHTFITHWNETVTEYEPSLVATFTCGSASRSRSLLLERADSDGPDELHLIEHEEYA